MAIRYIVMCLCDTQIPVGWIDDYRPDGPIRIRMHPKHKYWLGRKADKRWKDRNQEALRCCHCRKSAQFSSETKPLVCDRLAAGDLGDLRVLTLPNPDLPAISENQYLIQLGVLCKELSQHKG
jgi:hypothetical protein